MEKGTKIAATFVLLVLVGFSILGMFNVLPNQVDIVRASLGESALITGQETYEIDYFPTITQPSYPTGIVTDSSGDVWFGMRWNGNLGKLSGETMTEYPFYVPFDSYPLDIDDYDNIWTAASSTGELVKYDNIGDVWIYDTGIPPYYLSNLHVDKFNQIWYDANDDTFGKMTQAGVFTEYVLPILEGDNPLGITSDSNGNIWVATTYSIIKMTQAGVFTFYDFSDLYGYGVVIPDEQDNIWFWADDYNEVPYVTYMIQITPTGDIEYYLVPEGNIVNYGLLEINGKIWMTLYDTELFVNTLTYFDTSTFEFTILQELDGNPVGGTTDGTYLYWTDYSHHRIGRLTLSVEEPEPTPTPEPPVIVDEINFIVYSPDVAYVAGTPAPPEVIDGYEIPVCADVSSPDGIDEVWLIYKPIGADDWLIVEMTQTSGNELGGRWCYDIPAQSSEGTVEYQILVKDSIGNEVYSPTYSTNVVAGEEITVIPTISNASIVYSLFTVLLISVAFFINRETIWE